MTDSEPEYGLVMPFVVCATQGGPYEDGAFVAGCCFGQISQILRHCQETGADPDQFEMPVPTPLVPQLDLLAMHHGFTMTSEPWAEAPDEHTFVTFTVPDPPDADVVPEETR